MEKQRGRPRKFTDEQVRDRLVKVGIEALLAAGVSQGLVAINFEAAISEADVPRGSAYRVWDGYQPLDGTPQDRLRRAVLLAVLRDTPGNEGLKATYEAAAGGLAELVDPLASPERADLDRASQALMRITGAANFAQIRNSQRWRVYKALAVSASTSTDPDDELMSALADGELRMFRGYVEFFTEMIQVFQLELKPEYSLEDFTMCAYAVNEGLSNRTPMGFRLDNISRPTGPHGEMEPWSLFSVAFEALVYQFFQPVQA